MRTTINSSVPHKLLTALVILSMVMVALPATTAFAAGSTITVTTTNDEYDGGPANLCSLREAIALANHPSALTLNDCSRSVAGPDDVIVLTSGSTYTLTRTGLGGTSEGDLDIGDVSGLSGNLTIQTSSAGSATIDANDIDRVFDVGAAGNPGLALNNIVVTNGNSATTGGGISFTGTGTLSLTNVTVSSSVAASGTGCGAGIYNNSAATVVITDSTISGNSCPTTGADGAGILKGGGGTLTITGSTISGNNAAENGGGIHIGSATGVTASITNSTFANNIAGNRGGGLQVGNVGALVTVDFTTFSGNSASEVSMAIPNVTGGGALQVSAAASVAVTRSILANSTTTVPGTAEDCDLASGVTTVSVSDSIIETNADGDCGPSGVLNVDPQLGALASNGGPTQTMAISLASPAYNAADSCGAVVVDQRGATRPQVGACDLGAYESGNTTQPTVVSVTRVGANPTNDASVDFTVSFSVAVTGVDATDFKATVVGITGASVTNVTGTGATRTVTVNTGTGDGTLRLDVLDDGTIVSGADGLDGGFTNGEVYDVDKTAPTATITRTDPNILGSATVDFGVSFSEAVTGVQAADFNLTVSSGITGASVSGITGLGATYTATVNTGSGDGTIGLNLDAGGATGIVDAAGNAISSSGVTGEVYTILKSANAVDVNVAGTTVGDGIILPFQSGQRFGAVVDNGPAQVVSTNGFDIVTALRVIWKEPGPRTSYSEMMGLPVEQLSSEYWFPWYNNLDTGAMDQGFRIANVDDTDTTVRVMLGTTQLDSFTLLAGQSVRKGYAVNNGPIQIYSVEGTNILAALRVIWVEPGPRYSYSEMMGLPVEQLSTEYWYPWYNNLDTGSMDQGFRIANVDNTAHTVRVFLGTSQIGEDINLAGGGSTRVGYAINNGPIRIVCTTCNPANSNDRIITSLRVIWQEPGFRASYSEMMGLPLEQLSDEYWYPWYNNVDTASMDQGFRIAVVNASGSNTIEVWVAGTKRETFSLAEGASVRVGYAINDGPARIVCTTCSSTEKIITSLRVIWKEPGFRTSYSEMMGLPNEALSTEYWFPWYNNAAINSMDQGFRIGAP